MLTMMSHKNIHLRQQLDFEHSYVWSAISEQYNLLLLLNNTVCLMLQVTRRAASCSFKYDKYCTVQTMFNLLGKMSQTTDACFTEEVNSTHYICTTTTLP